MSGDIFSSLVGTLAGAISSTAGVSDPYAEVRGTYLKDRIAFFGAKVKSEIPDADIDHFLEKIANASAVQVDMAVTPELLLCKDNIAAAMRIYCTDDRLWKNPEILKEGKAMVASFINRFFRHA